MKVTGREAIKLQKIKTRQKVESPETRSRAATPRVFPIDVSPLVGAKEPSTPWTV